MQSDKIIEEVQKNSNRAIEDVKIHASELENSIRYRVADCETLVKSRINETYVKDLGEKIKTGILESVRGLKIVTDSFLFSSIAQSKKLSSGCTL